MTSHVDRPPCLKNFSGQLSRNVTYNLIQKSFHACGISVYTDGTEDEEIHCLKEGGVAADARESIWRDTTTLATATDSELEESDPFADVEEDKDELEENELVPEDY